MVPQEPGLGIELDEEVVARDIALDEAQESPLAPLALRPSPLAPQNVIDSPPSTTIVWPVI